MHIRSRMDGDRSGRSERQGDPTHCLRCQGLMVAVLMRDLGGGEAAVSGWRCLLCGEAIDPGIEANRASHDRPARNRARVPGSPPAGLGKGRA